MIHTNPDEVVDAIMAAPLAMIASDGSLQHPRGAGSYSRVLSRYVRDRQSLTLPEAIRKMSLMPAQRLEALTPEAKRLGRLQVGARADIVVFDAGTVADRATFSAPTEPSEGVRYLVVDGAIVVDDGRFIDSDFPGSTFAQVEALNGKPRQDGFSPPSPSGGPSSPKCGPPGSRIASRAGRA